MGLSGLQGFSGPSEILRPLRGSRALIVLCAFSLPYFLGIPKFPGPPGVPEPSRVPGPPNIPGPFSILGPTIVPKSRGLLGLQGFPGPL
jgi:hypothetical protein